MHISDAKKRVLWSDFHAFIALPRGLAGISNHFPTVHGLNSKPPIDFCLTAAYLGLEKFSQQKKIGPMV